MRGLVRLLLTCVGVTTAQEPRLRIGGSCLADCSGGSSGATVIDVQFARGTGPLMETISIEFNGVPLSCVNVPISHPCLGHDRRPPLWWVTLTASAGSFAVGPLRAHMASTLVPNSTGAAVDAGVTAVRLDVPGSAWASRIGSIAGSAVGTDAAVSVTVSVQYMAATGTSAVAVPYAGVEGGAVISVGAIPHYPPPSTPPSPPSSPPPPLLAGGESELQIWLDASATFTCGASTCVQGGTSYDFKDKWTHGRHYARMGAVEWRSTNINGREVGWFDINTGTGFSRETWAEWELAPRVTAEVWANLRGYRSTNTGIVTHFVGGSGKHNWMWNSAGRYHNNGMKGSAYLGTGLILNAWTHLALVGGDGGFRYYQNGVLMATQSYSGDLTFSGGRRQMGIGMREDGVEAANAKISVVRIYNRALDEADVVLNYETERASFGV